jgi:TolB-like protein
MDAASVREGLERILASPGFDASERNRRFLRYIVEEALAGRADQLKGVTIAMDVFGRDATIDPQQDPVVRIEAAKLRRSLERYYLIAGRDDPIRIDIPKGAYVPSFEAQVAPLADARPADGPAAAVLPPAPGTDRRRWYRPATFALAIVFSALTAVASTAAWFGLDGASSDQNGADAAGGLQLSGPAVVVAPFANLSGTETGELLAAGLTQELITNLMRFDDLRVYSANSNERWASDPDGFSRELQVGYEVMGSVLRAPDQIRLAVQLLEVDSGRYLWSETFDRPLTTANLFDIQEEVAAQLAGHLAEPHGVIHQVTADRFRRQRPATMRAYDCVLQSFAVRQTFRRDHYLASRGCLEQAVREDPDYPIAWAMLAYAHLDEYRWYGWGPLYGKQEALDQALAAAQRAIELDPEDVMTLSAYSVVQFYRGNLAEAEEIQRRAVALNPNNPEALSQLGWRIAFARNWDEGIALARQAARLSMAQRGWYYLFLTFDGYRRGDYQAGLADLNRLGDRFFFLSPALMAMFQAQLGHPEKARAALAQAIARNPTLATDPRGTFRLHRTPEDLIDQFVDGLRKAGLEQPSASGPSNAS